MEVLRHLEDVHRTLALMDAHSLLPPQDGASSHQLFFAKFLLFMVQVSKTLTQVESNLQLLVEYLPQISKEFLQDLTAQHSDNGKPPMGQEASLVSERTRPKKVAEGKFVPDGACKRKTKRTCTADLRSAALNTYTEQVEEISETFLTNGVKTRDTYSLCDEDMFGINQKDNPQCFLAPFVELRAMERARSTLEDFCRSYFMFHGLDDHKPQDIFKFLPMLMFVEAYIYQVDEENERLLDPATASISAASSGAEGIGQESTPRKARLQKLLPEKWDVIASTEAASPSTLIHPFKGLCAELANRGLMTERIAQELRSGLEYWSLEQSLCRALSKKSNILIEDVMRTIELKSFDYRVLNLLLYGLLGTQVNEAHLDFLRTSELLVEISDDLFDYEEDVLSNNFNIIRMFVGIYGPIKAPSMLANCICTIEDKFGTLLKTLEPSLASSYELRCQEATMEGGSKSKSVFGMWTLPPLIVDEASFRSNIQ